MKTFSVLVKKLWRGIKDALLGRKAKQQEENTPAPEEEVVTPSETRAPSKKPVTDSLCCPYCESKKFVRRGFRKKKYEKLQLYLCLNCHKTFSPVKSGGGQYPLEIVFDAISLYNQGYSLEQVCNAIASSQFPVLSSQSLGTENSLKTENCELKTDIPYSLSPSTLSDWLEKYKEYCKYARMREFATMKYAPKDTVETATLAHRQLYRYRFHRAKCNLMILQEFQHRKFEPLKEFLELVTSECPHQYFSQGLRASEAPLTFSKKQMIVRSKQNYATKLCQFVLQGVTERDKRHNAIQKFFLYNDSVTIATEVPVYLTREDMEHMKSQLGFEVYGKSSQFSVPSSQSNINDSICKHRKQDIENCDTENSLKTENCELKTSELPKLITGHIDLLQIRNGQIHILDYKPNAAKEQPIDQLTIYAMALSRLTGLRLFEFKCAWFDEKDYFEFFPLHVLYKPNKTKRRKRVKTIEGTYKVNEEEKKVISVKPQQTVTTS